LALYRTSIVRVGFEDRSAIWYLESVMMIAPQLPPGQQLVAPGRWPFVGERQPRADDTPWLVTIAGAVAWPRSYGLHELRALPQVERTIDIHCVTRWSKLGAHFSGVPLAEMLRAAEVQPSARFVSFVARSDRAHSTSLPLADALALDTLLALDYEDGPLPTAHGGPVRTVVPGRYFYKSLKWLERIELLTEDRLGYWEATAGYHNTADPWLQQRYIAPSLTKQQAAALIAARDFSGRDLRGISASGHGLSGLVARGALLRDADFRRCDLRGACFDGANLTNAHLEAADLRLATFRGADLEGANFTAADLGGADLSGASLFGATFMAERDGAAEGTGAQFDAATRLAIEQLEALTPIQAEFMRSYFGPGRAG
jgi:DMSO/TMAO reductase YedYZ molybdopterin-dependent catalytic subunit